MAVVARVGVGSRPDPDGEMVRALVLGETGAPALLGSGGIGGGGVVAAGEAGGDFGRGGGAMVFGPAAGASSAGGAGLSATALACA